MATICAATLFALTATSGAIAETPPTTGIELSQATEMQFDLPQQPLGDALTGLGIQSGLQVSVDTPLVQGLQSPEIKGSMSAEQALDMLLRGTGLTWRFDGANTVIVEKLPQSTGDGVMMLDAITISGEKISRSLMDTASSVAVFDSETIERNPRLDDIDTALKGLGNIVSQDTGNYAPVIRGINGAGPSVGADAFFAGVRPRLNMQVDGRPTTFNETIYGNVPLWDVEQVEVFRGPQSTVQGRNAIAGAIVVKTKDPTFHPEAKIRAITGNLATRTYSGMVSGPIVEDQVAVRLSFEKSRHDSDIDFANYAGDDDPSMTETINVRAKLLVEPENLQQFRGLLTINHSDVKGPQGEYVEQPYSAKIAETPEVPTFHPRVTSGVLETGWEFNDTLSFNNVVSASDIRVIRRTKPNTGNVKINGREYVLEPRLNYEAVDGNLSGFAGLYGLRAKQNEYIDLFGGGDFDDETSTRAVFGEGTWAVLDDVDLTLGARYEEETREREGAAGSISIDFEETYKTFLPKIGAAWHIDENLTVGTTVARGYNGGGAGITWASPFVAYTYDPEYVWNYEAYARSELLDGRLRLNGNVFYADYTDIQLPYKLGTTSTVIRNADEAIVYGAEFGGLWAARPDLDLTGEIGLLQTEVTSYPDSGFEGNELFRSPALTASAGAMYHKDGFEFGVDVRYSEAYYSDIANTPRGKTDPYWMTSLNSSYTFKKVKVFGYVDNLFDEETPVEIYTGTTDKAMMLPPRTFGVGVEVEF